MPRTKRGKPQLAESWDAVDEKEDFPDEIYSEEEEREEMGSGYIPDPVSKEMILTLSSDEDDVTPEAKRNAMRNSRTSDQNGSSQPRKRTNRAGANSELIMPSSPDALKIKKQANMRASTPHFRLNQRSLTSDAGRFNKPARQRRDSHSDDEYHHHGKGYMTKEEAEYDDQVDDSSDLNLPTMIWNRVLRPLLGYVGSVFGVAAKTAQPILGYLLLIWLALGLFTLGGNFLNNSINNALSPICRLPFTSSLPFCPMYNAPALNGPTEFDKLVQAQDQLNEVLETTAVSANLPLDMKRSEASMRDLKHVVTYSTLPSRNELVFEFGGFIDTAKKASEDLSKFNSRIGRAVDHILSTNRWTLQVIDGVAAADASRGAVAKWVSKNLDVLAPFRPISLSQDVLMDQYLRHTSAVEEQIVSLIEEAQALLNILDNLDGRLDVVANIATRDGIKIADNREELFATLWTKLGGNRNSVAKMDQQMHLLKEVGTYRRIAWAHVSGTIVKLQAIRDNLEDLRERVALPETVGDKVPLTVHIDNINLGIERLEQQRDASRRLEADNYARILNKAEERDRLIGGREV